jgi:outer membrane receptor protein involved in Fe transport
MVTGEADRYNVTYGLGLYNIGDYRYSAPVSGEFRQRSVTQNGRTLMATLGFKL